MVWLCETSTSVGRSTFNSLGTTLSFSKSTFHVNENEGPAQPELALSVPALFDFNVFITSVNVHLAGKLYYNLIITAIIIELVIQKY